MSNNKKTNKKSILNKIASSEKEYEEKLEEEKKVSVITRTVDDEELYFEIYDDDNKYQEFLKSEINKAHIMKTDVYNVYGREYGYRLIYTLRKNVVSLKSLEEWFAVLGKEIVLTVRDIV